MSVVWNDVPHAIGLLSGILSALAFVPYIFDVIRGQTEPQRSSWLIWSILGTIALFSQIYEGALESLYFAGVQVSGTILVFLLSVRKGFGAYIRTRDILVLGAATLGVLLWYYTDNSGYALAITISISLLGGSLTVLKAYEAPESETLLTWVLSFVASIFALFAVGSFAPILLAYPLYLFTLYGAFIIAIFAGRARRRPVLPQPFEDVVARIPVRHETDGPLIVADRLDRVRADNSVDP